jgi:hypothetical protein
MGNIGHQVATHLLVASRVLASWLKSCARRPSSSLRVDAGGEIPGASLCVPSTSRFTGASRPRASGKVASAASRVARATISQLVRFAGGQS